MEEEKKVSGQTAGSTDICSGSGREEDRPPVNSEEEEKHQRCGGQRGGKAFHY